MVNYVVLAEFDIDTGSTVRHQYPQSIDGYTEDWLAEHMLPEGLHNRTEDWTYIFLNRETSSDSCSPSLVVIIPCAFLCVSPYSLIFSIT